MAQTHINLNLIIFRECPMTSSERYSTFKVESQSSSPPHVVGYPVNAEVHTTPHTSVAIDETCPCVQFYHVNAQHYPIISPTV